MTTATRWKTPAPAIRGQEAVLQASLRAGAFRDCPRRRRRVTLSTLFIAQALGVDLSFSQQLTILVVAMLTSKGASGVTGAGFITLAATLAVVDPRLVPGMAVLLGIDKFMSECRALTNIIGNGVATIVVSRWENELDHDMLKARLGQSRSQRYFDRSYDGIRRHNERRMADAFGLAASAKACVILHGTKTIRS